MLLKNRQPQEQTRISFGNDNKQTQISFGNDNKGALVPFGNDNQKTAMLLQLRQCRVTGSESGCSGVPLRRACLRAKYHLAGLSASSMSMSEG